MSDILPKSASKLIPKDPSKVMVIRDVTSNITTLSVPFLRFGMVKVGGRATIVKMKTGSLAVFSPVALTSEVKAKVASMGTMKYIVAPDIEHHIFMSPWAQEYPNAELIGPEGLPEKRQGDPSTSKEKFKHVFTPKNQREMQISPEWDAEFDCEYFHSHQNKELVFLHKPSKTLIEADVLFNLPAAEQFSRSGVAATAGVFSKLFGAIMNTRGDMVWQKRFLWYGAASSNRTAFADSAKRVARWDFDRIIPCHGDVIETGGKSVFNTATAWFQEAK